MIAKSRHTKSTKEFERKIYDINKVLWHADKLCELHHAVGRVGVRLCCPALWTQGKEAHHSNHLWISQMRQAFKPVERRVLENYIKGVGCKAELFKTCAICAMPAALEELKKDQDTEHDPALNNTPRRNVEKKKEHQNENNS